LFGQQPSQVVAFWHAWVSIRIRAAACEGQARAELWDASCGPSRGEAAARTVLTDRPAASIPPKASPQPGGRACDELREDAALRLGAAAGCCALKGANSSFNIQNSEL